MLQLLSLDRSARPQSAAEVMERLSALAGLSMDERIEVSRAYLATPTLVGREKALIAVRRRMLSLVRGDGGALLLEGAPGSGRSRLLDACVLEAKLLGAIVLRADASDGAAGDWGVARAIGTQLLELMPAEANEAARLSRNVLAHVIDGLAEGDSRPPSIPERGLLLRELRDFVLALSRPHRLLIAIDDFDRTDEPSAALLAALSHKTEKHSLMLAVTADKLNDSPSLPSLRLLRGLATQIEVEQLTAEQTEALVRSVFGDVAHLSLVAGRIHALSQGNPRATMELAQHLCDRGLARYQAGSWLLPKELDEGDLPNTLAISLATRLSGLTNDARELCELLALADGEPLTLSDYAGLTEHKDGVRVYRALDELVAARVLLADAERYRFNQRGFIAVVSESLGAERRVELHARLAHAEAIRGGDQMRLVHHLIEGGRDREAVELLVGQDIQANLPPMPLLERALAASEQLKLSARTIHVLRNALLSKAPMVLAAKTFQRELKPVLDQLEADSGLLLYRELARLAPAERLSAALTRTQERFQQTPENERVYPILDAIRELARFSGSFVSLAMQLMDIAFLETLPSLEPLMPLSPSLTVVGQIITGAHHSLRGSTVRATEIYEQVLKRIAEPDRAGFDETYHRGIRLGLHYVLGLLEASLGMSAAEQRAQLLETDREHRVQAWRVRVSLHLNQGNADEARKCLRRAELLQLQEGSAQRYLGTSAGFELLAHALTGDLIGVKRALDGVNELAQHYAGWLPVQQLGQCYYRWLQGDLHGALDALMPAVVNTKPGRHPYFCYVAAAHVNLLADVGRVDEAVGRGRPRLHRGVRARADRLARPLGAARGRAGALAPRRVRRGGRDPRASDRAERAAGHGRPLARRGLRGARADRDLDGRPPVVRALLRALCRRVQEGQEPCARGEVRAADGRGAPERRRHADPAARHRRAAGHVADRDRPRDGAEPDDGVRGSERPRALRAHDPAAELRLLRGLPVRRERRGAQQPGVAARRACRHRARGVAERVLPLGGRVGDERDRDGGRRGRGAGIGRGVALRGP
jgi:hypothetical protein